MRTREEILGFIYNINDKEYTQEELQLEITLNPSLKKIVWAMQTYADQEVNKIKKTHGIRKSQYDFSNDEEYRQNSNC